MLEGCLAEIAREMPHYGEILELVRRRLRQAEECEKAQETARRLLSENERLRQEQVALKAELAAAKAECGQLLCARDKTTQECQQLAGDLEAQKALVCDLKRKNGVLRLELFEVKNRQESQAALGLQGELIGLQNENRSLREMMRKLRHRVKGAKIREERLIALLQGNKPGVNRELRAAEAPVKVKAPTPQPNCVKVGKKGVAIPQLDLTQIERSLSSEEGSALVHNEEPVFDGLELEADETKAQDRLLQSQLDLATSIAHHYKDLPAHTKPQPKSKSKHKPQLS